MDSKDGTNKSFTSTNKWTYVPGKVFTLTPLNINDIKQLLDSSEEDIEDVESDTGDQIEDEKNYDEGNIGLETYKSIDATGVSRAVKDTSNLILTYNIDEDVIPQESPKICRKPEKQPKKEIDQDLGHNSLRTERAFTPTPLNIRDDKQLLDSSKDDMEDVESDRDNLMEDEENDEGDFGSETYKLIEVAKDLNKAEIEEPNFISSYNRENKFTSHNSFKTCKKPEEQKEMDHDLEHSNSWTYIPRKVSSSSPLSIQDIKERFPENSQNNTEAEESDTEKVAEDEKHVYTENNINPGVYETIDSKLMHNMVEKERPNTFSNNSVEKSVSFQHNLEKCRKPEEQTRNEIDHGMKCYNHSRNNASDHRDPSYRSSLESIYEDSLSYTKRRSIQKDIGENKENISQNMEPLNLSTDKRRTEDSFDLDLSALSLHTPVKKKENFNYVTPKINIIPPSDTKSVNRTGTLFKTPNVSNNPYALKKLFKTPINKPLIGPQYAGKNQQGTPFHSLKKTFPNGQSEAKENSENQKHSGKNQQGTPYGSLKKPFPRRQNEAKDSCENEKVPTPLRLYPSQDEFERITVNSIEYIVMNLLGRGGSSEVFHCFNPEEKLHVAIKLVLLSDPTTAEGYINEVKLLESLQRCDRIIKMYDYEIQEEKLMVVLENGAEDLSTILKDLAKKQNHLPLYMLLYYWMEMLYAVKQIHSNGVIHSDLKPANFLRANSGLKLIDFGIASKVQGDMTCVYKSNQEGSCNYISPEALNVQTNGNVNSPSYGKPKYKVHFKSDVWSLGCILYQLVYRRTPFQHLNPIWTKLSAIVDPKHKIEYPKADWVPTRIVDTIKRCLQYDVRSRPSVDELLEEYEELFRL